MKNITIIIPARNEETSLKKLLKKFRLFKKFYKEIIVIDGQSSDKTIEIAKKNNCRIIKQKRLGYGGAIIKGVKAVKTKYFIIFDADGSKDPRYLNRFIKKLKKDKTEIVYAERYGVGAGSLDDTIITHIGNRIFRNIESLAY